MARDQQPGNIQGEEGEEKRKNTPIWSPEKEKMGVFLLVKH